MKARPHLVYGWYIILCGFLSQGRRVGLGPQTFDFFALAHASAQRPPIFSKPLPSTVHLG